MIKVPNFSCPNCAASLSFSADNCPYCNTHVATPIRMEERQKAATLFVTAVNEEFMRDGWRINGVTSLTFALPIVTVILSRRYEQSWLLAIALGFVVLVIFLAIMDAVTNRVHAQKFDAQVKPQLLSFVDKTDWSLHGLLATISDVLPEDAVLRKFVGRL